MNNAKNPGFVGAKMRVGRELIVVHSEHDRREGTGAVPDVSAPAALSTITCVVIDSERRVLFYNKSLPATEEILEEALHCSIYHILEVQRLSDSSSN